MAYTGIIRPRWFDLSRPIASRAVLCIAELMVTKKVVFRHNAHMLLPSKRASKDSIESEGPVHHVSVSGPNDQEDAG
jgi:hypothetical protein